MTTTTTGYMCDVLWAGPSIDPDTKQTHVFFGLKEKTGAFAAIFMAPPEQANSMLATALAALTAGRAVQIWVTVTSNFSTVYQLFLQP